MTNEPTNILPMCSPTFITIPSERLQELEDQLACDLATIVDLRNQITRLNKIIDGLI